MSEENIIYVNKYDAKDTAVFPINEQEIWRYSGCLEWVKNGKPEAELKKLLDELLLELNDSFQFRVCFRRIKLFWDDDMPQLPFAHASKNLAKALNGCDEAVLFAATIGLEIDRKIAKYEKLSPAKALLLHAFGAERIESLCDGFCGAMEKEAMQNGRCCSPRFSPGYGDLPLEIQKDIFQLLDCNRKIGISLNNSLLMTPSKSVTAVFGIGSCEKLTERYVRCESCNQDKCEYRSNGNDKI